MNPETPDAVPTQPAVLVPAPKSTSPAVWLALVLSCGALGLSAWHVYDAERSYQNLTQQWQNQETQLKNASQSVQDVSSGLRTQMQMVDLRLKEIEDKQNASAAQFAAVERMYQTLSSAQEEWRLSEFEHALSIATQQLYLGGNIEGAIKALSLLETRLNHEHNPRFLALRQAVHQDLERLRSQPVLDLMSLTVKLENLADEGEELPLVVDVRRHMPTPEAQQLKLSAGEGDWQAWLRHWWADVRATLLRAVQVRRLDRADVALLAPDQVYFLRQNIRLRLLDARISMLQRDEAGYLNNLQAARAYVEQHCDLNQNAVQTWLNQLSNLEKERVVPANVDVSASLDALRALRMAMGGVRAGSILDLTSKAAEAEESNEQALASAAKLIENAEKWAQSAQDEAQTISGGQNPNQANTISSGHNVNAEATAAAPEPSSSDPGAEAAKMSAGNAEANP